jgi:hypothetical protein
MKEFSYIRFSCSLGAFSKIKVDFSGSFVQIDKSERDNSQ